MPRLSALTCVLALALGCAGGVRHRTPAIVGTRPLVIQRLPNGLQVVIAPDAAAPLVHVGLYYKVGARDEPVERAGFAHLFEHLMFEGSPSLRAGEYFKLVVSSGGAVGAQTLYDLTKFEATVPSNALQRQLWAEADRMRGWRVDSARFDVVRNVVKNEVRQQTVDRPYGRFAWIDIHEIAQTKWVNAHSIYGDEPDGTMRALDSATLADAQRFFSTYYTPDNAVLVLAGDVDPAEANRWVRAYFGVIPRGVGRLAIDRSEPRQTAERRAERTDRNAPQPALAVAYHMPSRDTPDFWTMQVIDQILIEGRDSRMHRSLVQHHGLVDAVHGGVSARHGSIYTTGGPNFWTVYVYHRETTTADSILVVLSGDIERLRTELVDSVTLARAIRKAKADLAAELTAGRGQGLADMLGQFALFDGDAWRVESMPRVFDGVTPRMVRATAQEYLRSSNRTILTVRPGAPR